MSFDLICSQCGAASGPSVGTCPFCKSVLVGEVGKSHPAVSRLKSLYDKGLMEEALLVVREIQKNEEKYGENTQLQLLCAKVLLETEAPTTLLKSMLVKASLLEPENSEIADFMALLNARTEMSFGSKEQAKQILWHLLQRNPNHVHGQFLYAVFLNMHSNNPVMAIEHLEKCVLLRPNFLRAWGCMAAIAQKIGHGHYAERALSKCVELETNGKMKQYFKGLLNKVRSMKKAA